MDTDLNGVRLFVFAFIIILLSIFCGVLLVDRKELNQISKDLVEMEQKVIILERNVSKLERNVSDMKNELQVIRDTRLIGAHGAKIEKTSK